MSSKKGSSKKRSSKKGSPKKWLLLLSVALMLGVFCAASDILTAPLEAATDPSSALVSDPASEQESFPEPDNPKLSQLTWLDENHEQYDSYIMGSPSAAAYDTEELNSYLNAAFFNLCSYSYAPKDYGDFAAYLLERYTVKNLILNLDMSEAIHYYYEDSGTDDRNDQDLEKIGDPEVYESAYAGEFPEWQGTQQLPFIAECAQMVADIRDLCKERGARLIVINSPLYVGQWNSYDPSALRAYKAILADVVDYWDFSLTPMSFDSRYFYDPTHFRNTVGTMVLAEIFGNEEIYRPERFGTKVTAENSQVYLNELFSDPPRPETDSYTADVPILLYHHIAEDADGIITVTPETFERQICFLAENGYQAVTVQEMIDYVYRGGELPEKPVCITFDDGYLSNYEYAWPVLQQYGMKATIYAIGASIGHDRLYKDTEFELTPHFSFDQAREMMESGVIDIQSHTYDMHQFAEFESGDKIRETIAPLDSEDDASYAAALKADIARYNVLARQEFGRPFVSLAYPKGQYAALTEEVVHNAGILVTMSTQTDSRNILVRGLPQSLYALCRWYMTERTTPEGMLAVLE